MAGLDDLSLSQLQQMRAQITGGVAPVDAVHQIESGGAPDTSTVTNPASGASGSMQVVKGTKTDPGFGVKPSNGTPEDTARVGRDYYDAMQQRYKDPEMAAVAYNWGPGNADQWKANGSKLDDLPLETLQYLKKYKLITGQNQTAPAQPAQTAQIAPQTAAAPTPDLGQQQDAPLPLGADLMRQLGLTARAAGHGVADAVGVVANPLNTLVNAGGALIGHNPNLATNVDQTLRGVVDANTPTPKPGMETGINDVAAAIANPINMAMGGMPATGLTRAALMGAAGAANQPLHAGDDVGAYAGQVAGGAAGGALLGAAGRVLTGKTPSANVQALIDKGVTPTPGQVFGGAARSIEEKAASVPVLGEAMASAQRSTIQDMNKALYKEVLAPIGEKAPTTVGRDSIEAVKDAISNRYDSILPKLTFQADPQFATDMQPVERLVQSLPDDLQTKYGEVVDRNFFGQLDQNGQMNGSMFKKVESEIGNTASNFSSDPSAFSRDLGRALKMTQDNMRQALVRANPNDAKELQSINQAYSKYAILRNAASKVSDPSKPIMPGQLQTAVKNADKTIGKGAFGTGNANMQGLSDASMEVLGQKYPDSGTAGRYMLGTGLLGGSLLHPAAIPIAGLAGLYATDAGRKAMLAALVKRPAVVRAIGQQAGRITAPVGGSLAGLLRGGQ